MEFVNVYEDTLRAESYSKLEFPGTYYLAYRDLPEILSRHVKGLNALDFGCGTGRSTRFLTGLGFNVTGVDISEEMIRCACEADPDGNYILTGGDLTATLNQQYDLILSVFTFDNIAAREYKTRLFSEMKRLLKSGGRVINLVSSPLIYLHEWASFTTAAFPENRDAECGDRVKIVMKDVDDKRPVEDILWPHEDYLDVYGKAGLEVEEIYHPLGKWNEPINWISEREISPWVIYVLRKPDTLQGDPDCSVYHGSLRL